MHSKAPIRGLIVKGFFQLAIYPMTEAWHITVTLQSYDGSISRGMVYASVPSSGDVRDAISEVIRFVAKRYDPQRVFATAWEGVPAG